MYDSQITFERISNLAKKRNMGMNILQEKCGLSPNTIKVASKGKNGLSAKNLFAIAEVLECSVDYLLGRTDEISLNQGTVIQAGDVSGNIIAGDINGDHNANINTGIPEDISELVELIKSLPLIKRAEAILMLNKMRTEE